MTHTLDANRIYCALDNSVCRQVDALDVLDTVASTNTWLMKRADHDPGQFQVVLAEQQEAGRGRRGNRWVSPAGAGLYLSMSCSFETLPDDFSCLTLAAGVAVVRALERAGASGIKLKWPNDIYADNAKLGGILTEAQSGANSFTTVICGIGINLDLARAGDTRAQLEGLDYAATDLVTHCVAPPDPSLVAALIIDRVADTFATFRGAGFAPFLSDWDTHDWLKGKDVEVDLPDEQIAGRAIGVDNHGALEVDTGNSVQRVVSGTVRVAQASCA